jgi:hypothetical protein
LWRQTARDELLTSKRTVVLFTKNGAASQRPPAAAGTLTPASPNP